MKGLLITYFFPPANAIASHRVHSFARYLNTGNNTLDVICPEWEGELELPLDNVKLILTGKRKFDPNFGEIKLKGFQKIKRFIFHDIFKLNYFRSRLPGTFYNEVIMKLGEINLDQYDYILTSYAPLDSIHIGKYIKSRHPNIKWIIDYRDVYSLLEYSKFGWSRFFFKQFERKLTRSADGFITVSQTLKKIQEDLLQIRGMVIYNGFDDYVFNEDEELKNQLRNNNTNPLISYAGSLYKGERDVEPFFNYIHTSQLDEKFNCVFAVLNDSDEIYLKKIIQQTGIKNVTILRNLTYAQAMTLQKEALFLLLLSNIENKANGYLTGKVFEYMSFKKPVIYSGCTQKGYELYELIKALNLGENFSSFDYNNITSDISKGVEQFHRKKQADQLIEFINQLMKG